MSEEFPSKIIFDEFCEIVANIQKMKFYSSYSLQYYLQNVGVEAICMEGSQSRFRIKRGSWCCHWMQYAARDLIRPRYLFSLNDNPRCVKRFCIMSLISSSSIEQNMLFSLFSFVSSAFILGGVLLIYVRFIRVTVP